MTRKQKTLYVIDGHANVYRAFYVKRNMSAPGVGPTNAAFGFTDMLRALLRKHKPDYLVVAFDAPGPTFRHEMYPEYKATRPKMPDELRSQIPYIFQVCEGYRIPALEVPGFEADDVMGTLARLGVEKGLEVCLVTSDKDLLQLVSDEVRVYDPDRRRERVLDPEGVEKERGLRPEQFRDFLALTGDTSDNVPGVPGVGPKTAQKLLAEYGTLEGVLSHASEQKGKLRERLEENADQARLSQDLVTIRTDAPVELDLEAASLHDPDAEKLIPLFQKLNFRKFLSTIAPSANVEEAACEIVDTKAKFGKFLARLAKAERVSVDTETTSVQPVEAELVGLSFAFKAKEAFYVPVRGPEGAKILPMAEVLDGLRPHLENPKLEKIGQNLKYDITVLENAGVRLAGVAFDTMVADWLINPSGVSHGIDAMALAHLGYRKIFTSEVTGSGDEEVTMDLVPVDKVAPYACEDADIALRLAEVLAPKIEERGLAKLFGEVEMPLVPVLAAMERQGVSLDERALGRMASSVQELLAASEEEIHRAAGREFNIASPKQLAEILFDEMKLPVKRRTKTGRSVNEAVLRELAGHHELPRLVIEHRSLAKLKGTYLDTLPFYVSPRTGRIHTSFHQTGTATGRLSSSEPNLQNIPVRTELGRSIRACFVPRRGCHFLSADYSQIELRMLAHVSNDPALVEAFRSGADVHRNVAAQVAGKKESDVTPEERGRAKTVNFGIIYGVSPAGLAAQTDLSRDEAREFIDAYFTAYPRVKACREEIIASAVETGYVTTVLGRRRNLPDIKVPDPMRRGGAERMAVNTVFQGSAADLIKLAMIAIHRALASERPDGKPWVSRMILQIHDELLFEAPPEELAYLRKLVTAKMEGAMELRVPLTVSIGTGKNWLEIKS